MFVEPIDSFYFYFISPMRREPTNSAVPEPEGSSPYSQQPANGPCLELGESTP
jgi:hypothetical protein